MRGNDDCGWTARREVYGMRRPRGSTTGATAVSKTDRSRGRQPPTRSRLLKVLDAFSDERNDLSLSEISRHTGIPLTSTHRLVADLTAWGALERDERRRYRIGLRLWEIATLSPRGLGLRQAAMPFLEDLYEATHENVQLAVLDGFEVVYVERLSGRDAVNVLSRVGGRFPAHATGVGLVLLAYADAQAQERYFAVPLPRYTDKTIADSRQLRCVLADVRRMGYAISDGQVTLDALSVAAPIRGANDEVIAALSIVVPSAAAQPHSLAPAVVAAARGISRALRGNRTRMRA
jgi:DNA-binding IclR family transcriptional regulator